jgi:hypothetical protein
VEERGTGVGYVENDEVDAVAVRCCCCCCCCCDDEVVRVLSDGKRNRYRSSLSWDEGGAALSGTAEEERSEKWSSEKSMLGRDGCSESGVKWNGVRRERR